MLCLSELQIEPIPLLPMQFPPLPSLVILDHNFLQPLDYHDQQPSHPTISSFFLDK